MSVRVGHIMRHVDVHGVSGEGIVADVFEATNGKCIVIWRSAHSSVCVYDNVKHVETTHSHGGKTDVIWTWESAPDPDPMAAILEAEKPKLSDEEVEDIATEAAEQVATVAAKKVAEKIAEKVAEKQDEPNKGAAKKKAVPKKKVTPKKGSK